MPQSAHLHMAGSPAQVAQVVAAGPGGATSRRSSPQPEHEPRWRSAAVLHGSQTGPSGQRTAGGRSRPQRAQQASARGEHGGQTGWSLRAKLHSRYLPHTLQTALGIR